MERSGDDRNSPQLDEALTWLRDALIGGPRPARELYSEAERDGITKATMRRAKDRLRVTTGRDGFGEAGGWVWSLPAMDLDPFADPP